MDKINRFFECLLPTTQCNLKCEYCYIIQEGRRSMEQIGLDYDIKHIKQALSKSRVGGTSLFSICGTGETLLQKESVNLVHSLLKEGHYVNITTNGTITKQLEKLLNFDTKLLSHLHISFSLHYLELKKRNLYDVFYDNIKKVKNTNCSFLVQVNLYDGYLPYWEDIKTDCFDNLGAFPQVAATRYEPMGEVLEEVKLHTNLSLDEYIKVGQEFQSPLFDFTMQNFNVKRKEFCYAGDWSFNLNLKNGMLKYCYHSGKVQNIFDNIQAPIIFEAVGHNCVSPYCINSSHFISLGVIPEKKCPSYCELRNRSEAGWYTEEMERFLNQKLFNNHDQYSIIRRMYIDFKYKLKEFVKLIFK